MWGENGGGSWIRTNEAYAADLQSAPFDRSGIPPSWLDILEALFCLTSL